MLETTLILSAFQIVSQLMQAKIAHGQTTAAERAELLKALREGQAQAEELHRKFVEQAAGGQG